MSVNSPFGVTKFQLMGLMSTSHRPKERDEMLAEYGGVMGLADHLQTDPKKGISVEPSKLEMRKKEFGVNFIPPVPPKSFLALAFDAIQDKTLVILMIAAVVSIVLGVTVEEQKDIAWIEGFAILCAVFLVVIVTAVNDWTKERQFRGLQKKLDTTSKLHVIRGETSELLQVSTILVGDLVQFGYGNSLPVDGILYEGNDVKVDESAMTGEALLVKKRVDNNPFLFAGTRVMEGRGKMLVTAVGPNSQQGIIFQLMTQREEEAGFITHNYRRLRDFVTCKEKEKDVESGQKEEEEDVEVKEYEPDQPVDEEEPLTGCSRLNMFKRMQLAKEKRQRDKKKAAQKETEKKKKESGSLLQKKLDKFAIRIGYAGTAAAIFCIAVLSAKFSIEKFWIDGESWDASTDYSELLHFVIIGITVLVVAVPEGLPLAVTIALAFSVKKMLKDNNLVRHLHACETMGNATSICSDKTGTLTTNRMTVVESYFAGTRFEVTPAISDIPESILEVLRLNIAVNSSYTSKLIPDDAGDREEAKGFISRLKAFLPFKSAPGDGLLGQGLAKQVGNVTECALLGFLVELGIDYEAIRDEHPTDSLTKVFTFNSARKSMSTVITLPNGGHRLLTKGASEIVLNKCTSILGENGRIKHLSNGERKELEVNVVQSMASNALRTLCIAYRDFPPADDSDPDISSVPDWDEEDSIVSDLTCVGIVGIQDPVRPEVPTSILKCQQAGVTVRMVTGDNIETARAIAEKCGIISKGDGYLVMEGREFNRRVKDSNGEVSQDRMDRIWHRLRVLARSSPTDKHVLVNGIIESRLRKNREVVAVTGDGTNDGPALKRADVGFAMGIAGTDVAKEACDIILTDDNFTSIVKAVMWGRNVYDSISKFLQFQLTINIVAVLLAIISAFTIGDTPLRAVQLLWVNLIMDTLASLALATEAPTEELLKRKPYGRTKSLISRYMWLFIIGHSLYQLTVMFVLVFAGAELFDIDEGSGRELRADPTEHFTLVFNTFVCMQIFNEINARKIHGERNVFTHIHRNFIFIGVMIGQVSIQIIIVEFGDIVFSTSGLTLDLWLWCIFLGSTELIIEQLLLFIPVQKIPIFWKEKEEEPDLEEDNRARYLWVKSLTRVRTQIRVVNAFRASLESGEQLHISRLPHYTSTPRGPRYFSSSPSSKETTV